MAWLVYATMGLITSVFKTNIAENSEILGIWVILVTFAFIFYTICRQRIGRQAQVIFCAGIVLRIILMWWDIYCRDIYVLPNSGQDSEMYFYGAVNGCLYGDYDRSGLYGRFLSLWIQLFGVQRGCIQLTNTLLGFSTILLLIKIMEVLCVNDQTKDRVVELASLLPNTMITNAILLRETLIAFLVTFSIFAFVKWICRGNTVNLLASFVLVLVASAVHSGAIAVGLGEAVMMVFYDRRSNRLQVNNRSSIVLGLLIMVSFLLYRQLGSVFLGKFSRVESIDSIINTANIYNRGGASYDAGFHINNSILNLIINTPIRMFYFVASPLPWDWRGISDIIAFCFSSSVFLYGIYHAHKEWKYSKTNGTQINIAFFVILALCGAMIFAWGVSNAGTAVRHREKFISVFLLLIAVCSDSKWKRSIS